MCYIHPTKICVIYTQPRSAHLKEYSEYVCTACCLVSYWPVSVEHVFCSMCKVHRWVVDQWLCVDLRQSNDSVSEDSVHITPLLVHSALDSFYFKFKNVLQSGTGRSNVSLREAIKSHNRLNLGNHPNLPRPPHLTKLGKNLFNCFFFHGL